MKNPILIRHLSPLSPRIILEGRSLILGSLGRDEMGFP